MLRYDVKVYEGNEEWETVRDLTYPQLVALKDILERYKIKYLVREVRENGGI